MKISSSLATLLEELSPQIDKRYHIMVASIWENYGRFFPNKPIDLIVYHKLIDRSNLEFDHYLVEYNESEEYDLVAQTKLITDFLIDVHLWLKNGSIKEYLPIKLDQYTVKPNGVGKFYLTEERKYDSQIKLVTFDELPIKIQNKIKEFINVN